MEKVEYITIKRTDGREYEVYEYEGTYSVFAVTCSEFVGEYGSLQSAINGATQHTAD